MSGSEWLAVYLHLSYRHVSAAAVIGKIKLLLSAGYCLLYALSDPRWQSYPENLTGQDDWRRCVRHMQTHLHGSYQCTTVSPSLFFSRTKHNATTRRPFTRPLTPTHDSKTLKLSSVSRFFFLLSVHYSQNTTIRHFSFLIVLFSVVLQKFFFSILGKFRFFFSQFPFQHDFHRWIICISFW